MKYRRRNFVLTGLVIGLLGLIVWIALPRHSWNPSPSSAVFPDKTTRSTASGLPFAQLAPIQPEQVTPTLVSETYGNLPLSFEANHGQTDSQVKFISRASGYSLFLTSTEAVFCHQTEGHPSTVLRMKLVGANSAPQIRGLDELPGKVNYFLGNDAKQWHTNIPTYSKVQYQNVYPGVLLVYYGNQKQLEYDFTVAPGADPGSIALGFEGVDQMEIDERSDLVLRTAAGEIRQHKPLIYQDLNGVRQPINGGYVLKGKRQVGFHIDKYDPAKPLIIDPVLVYSTYLGGDIHDEGFDITVDADGSAYVTGVTQSSNFPTTPGAFQTGSAGGFDAFVTKLNVLGTALVYSTYLGGSSDDSGSGITVDAAGNAYVTGGTQSSNFPTTPGAFQPIRARFNTFVTKLNATGSGLVYSTYLSESGGTSITVDAAGSAYVMGTANGFNFPTTPGAFQTGSAGGFDAFVTKLNALGTGLIYSTYLGGDGDDVGLDITVDAAGSAYVTGQTSSANFPTTPGAFQTEPTGQVFVTKLNATGSGLVYSTYLGGGLNESGRSISVDAAGSAYITGNTASSNFPTTPGALQTERAGGFRDAFVTKLNTTGTALGYSTYLGGNGDDQGLGITADADGSVNVTGYTSSPNFPTTQGAFQTEYGGGGDGGDVFVTKLNALGSRLVYSTYLGGSSGETGFDIAVDAAGSTYVTGVTSSTNFPTTEFAFQPSKRGSSNAFVTKIVFSGSVALSVSAIVPDRGIDTGIVSVTIHGSGFSNGVMVKLARAGQADIVAEQVTVSSAGDIITATFDLSGKARGLWDLGVTNPDGTSAIVPNGFTIEGLSVLAIQPNRGGDIGPVTATIRGTVFLNGATAKLARPGQPDIVGEPVTVSPAGDIITTIFDLSGKAQGLWDLVVTNPDGTSATLPDAFTVEDGRAPQVWVDIVGLGLIRPGRAQTFHILYGNRGNVDAVGVPLWVAGIPRTAIVKPGLDIAEPPDVNGEPPTDFSGVPIQFDTGQEIVLPLFISRIPPGQTGALEIQITIPTQESFQIRSWTNPPYFGSPLHDDVLDCVTCAISLAADILLPDSCLGAVKQYIIDQHLEAVNVARGKTTIYSLGQLLFKIVKFGAKCAAELSGKEVSIVIDIIDFFLTGFNTASCATDCTTAYYQWLPASHPVQSVSSFDPNDKVGSLGVSELRHLSGEEPLRYSIFFENLETATAPAQEIVIIDQLDKVNMDLSTLSLGPITFGNKQVIPSPGVSAFTTDVDLRPDKNLIVRITVSLNSNTGLMTWRFSSLDPVTGNPPQDPLLGFLPPDINPPEGDGSVLFTVMPKNGLATGSQIRNQARIIFDTNPPIDTPEWFNVLDNSKPTSNVLPLPSAQSSASFNVEWQGTDVGSGVLNYTIFVSEDGGAFTSWLSNTSATSGTFNGQAGKTYGFYSVAHDQTGNREDPANEADATTQVTVDAAADLAITKIVAPDSVLTGSNVTYTITVSNNGRVMAENVTMADNLPAGTTFVSCSSTGGGICGGSGNNRTVTFTSLAPGSSATINLVVTVNCLVADNTVISNTATVNSSTPDTVTNNNSAMVTTIALNPPPVIRDASVAPPSLWPPNHTMRDVTVNYIAADNCLSTCTLSVRSNEPVNGTGDGDTAPDWEIVDAHHVRLRAERAAVGNGRTYTITITCTDAAGNSTSRDVTVFAAHNITYAASGAPFELSIPVTFAGTFWDLFGKTHTARWTFDDVLPDDRQGGGPERFEAWNC